MRTGGTVAIDLAILLLASIVPPRSLAAEDGSGLPDRTARDRASGPAESAESSALDAVRRDFEAVRTMRGLGPRPRIEGPALTMPGLQPPPPPVPPASRNRPEAGVSFRSPTWLVDAMETGRQRDESRDAVGKGSAVLPLQSEGTGHDRESSPIAGPSLRTSARTAPPNPFAAYLGQWMNPQDYTLLRPALEPNRPAAALLPPSLDASAEASTLPGKAVGPPAPSLEPGRSLRRGADSGQFQANPYLESISPVVRSSPPAMTPLHPQSSVTAPIARQAPAVAPAAPVSPAPRPASRIPSFVRPENEEKYFKPLKRF